ncbi:MAG: phospholipase D-like domain-containing protein [Candidatus Baltobacteraceae bacterium]
MIAVSSTDQLLAAIQRAREVTLSACTLRAGVILDALEAACRRGTEVTLRLEGRPFGDPSGELLEANQAAVSAVKRLGGDASLQDVDDSAGEAPLHMKAAVVDGVAFLDDRNWPSDGEDFIVRDSFPGDAGAIVDALRGDRSGPNRFFWTHKSDALSGEACLLYGATHARGVEIESESFGYSRRVYGAIKLLAEHHVSVRLLVSARDLNPKEQQALERLQQAGVDVRTCDLDEKMALVENRAWIGSSNATFGVDDQIDWGLRTDAPPVLATLHARFGYNWSAGTQLTQTEQ